MLTFSIPHSVEHLIVKPVNARRLRRCEWSTKYRCEADTLRRLIVQVEEMDIPSNLSRTVHKTVKSWRKRLQKT